MNYILADLKNLGVPITPNIKKLFHTNFIPKFSRSWVEQFFEEPPTETDLIVFIHMYLQKCDDIRTSEIYDYVYEYYNLKDNPTRVNIVGKTWKNYYDELFDPKGELK